MGRRARPHWSWMIVIVPTLVAAVALACLLASEGIAH